MFTKQEQRSWIKIDVALCRSTHECFQGVLETCDDVALPYRTVVGWVETFWEGKDTIQDNFRTGRSHVENKKVQLLASLMDCAWVSSGSRSMSQNCGPHSARHYGLTQTCSGLDIPWNFRGATVAPLCGPFWTGSKGKVTTFLDESSLSTKPGLAHTNQT